MGCGNRGKEGKLTPALRRCGAGGLAPLSRRVLSGAVAAVMMFAGGLVRAGEDDCAPDRIDLRGPWGTARFTVEVADDPQEQARGLMFRRELARDAGMLFVYPAPRRAYFWMKNTLIPLDMLFIDRLGRVRLVHENARPHDETPVDGGADVLMVLEINGGLARELGITPGSQVRHPALAGQPALWPCGG